MSNIISNWRKQQESRHGSIKEGCEALSRICDNKIDSSKIGEMASGERNIPDCIFWLMLNGTLDTTLQKFGYTTKEPLSSADWIELVNSLTPPKRK